MKLRGIFLIASGGKKIMEKKGYKRPFPNLNIDDSSHLFNVDERFVCSECKKSRKFFCYSCSLPKPDDSKKTPHVKLPIKIDIIKHKKELVGKSTSCHARLVSPENVQIYQYPTIPDYKDEDKAVLIFVSPEAVDIRTLFKGYNKLKKIDNYGFAKGSKPSELLKKNLSEIVDDEAREIYEDNTLPDQIYTLDNIPIKKAIFIDSTWSQCRGIFRDERLKNLNCAVIQTRETKFWRPNGRNHPSWFLATIEAIHQFLFEFHVYAFGIEKNYFENCLIDLKLISTDWIPKEKIIETSKEDLEKNDSMTLPYNGQYDNLLYYFSFVYSLVHSKVKKFINQDSQTIDD